MNARGSRMIALALVAGALLAGPPAGAAGLATLPGTVSLSDGAALPPGARLRLELHDMSPGVARDATVANQTKGAEGKLPLRFELPYNESTIEPNRVYGLAAALIDSRDQLLYETRVPIRVLTLGNQKKVDLVLRPAEKPKPKPDPTAFTVECEGLRFDVRLSDTQATLTLPDSKMVLQRTESFAGKRYSDGGVVFSVSGGAVYYQGPSRAYRDCKVLGDGGAAGSGK